MLGLARRPLRSTPAVAAWASDGPVTSAERVRRGLRAEPLHEAVAADVQPWTA